MKLVHARKRVWRRDAAFQNKFTLLVWILSLLQWKKFNYTTTLYTDSQTLNDIKSFGFDKLYDEINTTLLEDPEVCKDINFADFWATPKLLALWHETKNLNNEVVIADQDVVPIRDVSRLWTNCQVAVWNNREYIEFSSFPYVLELKNQYKEINVYLESLLNTIILKDIVQRNKIADILMLKSVLRFLFDNIGNQLSSKKIADTLTSNGRKIDSKTVEKYINSLMESYIISICLIDNITLH